MKPRALGVGRVTCDLFGRETGSWKGKRGFSGGRVGFLEQLIFGRLQGQEGSCYPFPGSPGKSPSSHPLCLAFPAKPRVGRETYNETNSHFMTSFPL